MKKIKFYVSSFFMVTMISLLFTNCSNNDSSQTARVTVRMVDAPGDYDEVNIDVLDVLIKDDSNTDDQGWISIGDNTLLGNGKIVNLLDLTGGVSVLLADNEVPSGYLGQIRLLLGNRNTLVKYDNSLPRDINKDIVYDLKTPSAQQSGLKLKVNQTLLAGVTYDFLLDFDVDRSVVKAGNSGNYNLHPVIRVSTEATSGVITGKIVIGTPPIKPEFAVGVSAFINVGDIPITADMNMDTGVFMLKGVPAGTYTVTFTPDLNSLYKATTIENVVVTTGTITNVGNQSLVLKP